MDKRGTVFLADAIHDSLVSEKDGTSRDVHDMHRMGKKQLLRVSVKLIYTLGARIQLI